MKWIDRRWAQRCNMSKDLVMLLMLLGAVVALVVILGIVR